MEPIGAGPNGSVARAKVFGVAGFERQFAVKRISPELTASPAAAQQLSAAARSYGSLEHPRIARMSEFGVAQGTTFTAVELVTGLDAMRLVADAKLGGTGLPAGGALALVSQIARAVGYAHGRGLTHLGLAPTNVIVTPDGDVKVTDFGILAATLPSRPSDFTRLSNRIAYLAPEQLAGEASSAATDVFALGVIAYELVTGQRAYTGDTPLAVAQAVLAGPPPDPALPRPIVRVLQRCLARSPFERFPDARALADALDAALRVAPVPGTRKDIGAQVKSTLDRLAALHEGELSGVLSLNFGTAAGASPPPSEPPGEVATTEFVRPDVPVAGPPPLVGPRAANASQPPAIPKIVTAPGLAPPPTPSATIMGMAAAKRPGSGSSPPASIPSIPKIISPRNPKASDPPTGAPPLPAGRGRFDSVPTMPGPSDRLAADDAARAAAEDVATRPDSIAAKPRAPSEVARGENLSRALSELGHLDEVTRERSREDSHHNFEQPTREHAVNPVDIARSTPPERELQRQIPQRAQSEAPTRVDPNRIEDPLAELDSASITLIPDEPDEPVRPDRDMATDEMSPLLAEKLNLAARLDTHEVPRQIEVDPSEIPPPASARVETPPPVPRVPEPEPSPSSTLTGFAPPPRPQSAPPTSKVPVTSFNPQLAQRKSGGSGLKVVLALLVIGGLGAGGYYGYTQYLAKDHGAGSGAQVATTGSDTHVAGSDTHVASGGSGDIVAMKGSDEAGAKGSADVGANGSTDVEKGSADVAKGSADVIAAKGSAEVAAKGSADIAAKGSAEIAAKGSAAKPGAETQAASDHPTATAPSDQLQITSTPGGARVFIDGADQGTTPVKLPGSSDRHNIALLMPGHDLYVAEVDGHGQFKIDLKPVTPTGGPAGIKVLKCKKDRYYVFVDGKPTGMLCPTERIHTTLGAHSVEVYDAVTESRQKFDINVPDDRLSVRVRLE
ncbi:MAG: protein kinase [Deltaproteobacteria bacterium]|nr:protein kinase [Deltaproteobacteria bacterium]